MARELKVYGWRGSIPLDHPLPEDKRHRVQATCVVAAYSKAEVVRITGVNGLWALDNLSETGNEHARKAALSKPGQVFFQEEFNHTPGEHVYVEHPHGGKRWP